MERTPWTVLGIEPTEDERAIKRAYAARVKVTSPEADPAGYMELREAYEAAKQHVQVQRLLAELRAQEARAAEAENDASSDAEPAVAQTAEVAKTSETETEVMSPQRQAWARLYALLSARDLEGFRQELEVHLAGETFATLEQQYMFVGAIAVILNQFQPLDPSWCGQIAERLNVRDHENPYVGDERFWSAYERLLEQYREWRATQARAHLESNAGWAAMPGYLHVYHVLTAPFDSERLNALLRSQNYHRLAERIFQRAASDATIVIPAENRAWWERTRMAGQHRPMPDAPPKPAVVQPPPAAEPERRIGFWPIWVGFIVLVNVARVFSNHSSAPVSQRELARIVEEQRPLVTSTADGAANAAAPERPFFGPAELQVQIAHCDPSTLREIQSLVMQLRIENVDRGRADADEGVSTNPRVAALLAKCPKNDAH